ncbi:MAG: hypothetical protein JWM16_1839, partial [Verrucomicrobiales bacterium]|nr:hypothetical protein [Verrucomicrobiales bacterium]
MKSIEMMDEDASGSRLGNSSQERTQRTP